MEFFQRRRQFIFVGRNDDNRFDIFFSNERFQQRNLHGWIELFRHGRDDGNLIHLARAFRAVNHGVIRRHLSADNHEDVEILQGRRKRHFFSGIYCLSNLRIIHVGFRDHHVRRHHPFRNAGVSVRVRGGEGDRQIAHIEGTLGHDLLLLPLPQRFQ